MNKFGYIINPTSSNYYQPVKGLNAIKLRIPIIKDDVIKISEIYDQNNSYMGDILAVPNSGNTEQVRDKLDRYIGKNGLSFVCLGDVVTSLDLKELSHPRYITGIYGVAVVSQMYIEHYLNEARHKDLYDSEILIAIDGFDEMTVEYIRYFCQKANYITLTGNSLEVDESVMDQIYSDYGISIGFISDYKKIKHKWDVFINLCNNIRLELLKNKQKYGMVLDPFFLIKQNDCNYEVFRDMGLTSKDIVFFSKLNIINNIYSPQLIESLVRIKYPSNENITDLIKREIELNEYKLFQSS